MATVADFCDEIARMGWQWGERDCLLWLGLWSERMTGMDGGAPWRGRYTTALGCMRVLNRSGGMMACIERGAGLAGMIELSKNLGELKAGAVGLVTVTTARGNEPVGGIFTGERWSVLTRQGVLSVRTDPLRAWNLP